MAQGFTRGVPIDTDPNLSLDSDLVVPSQKAVKDYIDTWLADKVDRAGDTMAGNLILNANPTLPLQAATKDYVDTLINGIDWKQAADAGTVAALPAYTVTGSGQILTGNVNGAIPSVTTDGVTLTANQRLLVKDETSTLTPNNGIYVVTQAGSGSLPFILTRSSDANTSALLAEATLGVKSGSTLANTQWHCNPAAVPIVIGVTYITFAQIGGGLGGNSIQALTGDVTASASAPSQSVTATLASNFKVGSCGAIFTTVSGVITNGTTAYAQVPYNGTITGWTLVSTSASGSCTVTVFKDTYANYPPTSPTDDIFTVQPVLVSQIKNQDLAPTFVGSQATVVAGDWIGFTISGVALVSWVNLTLSITKT